MSRLSRLSHPSSPRPGRTWAHLSHGRARLTQDAGASLVLVMGLLMFVGLVVIATLTYTTTSLNASADIAASAETSRDVDGALQAGVNQLRTSTTTGRAEPGGGASACPALVVPGPGEGRDVAVTCETLAGSGTVSSAITRAVPQAVLATGTAAPPGEAGVVARGGHDLLVAGDVASNSSIAARNGAALDATGAVSATDGCRGTVRGEPRDCSAPSVPVQSVRQPRSGFVPRSVPVCPGRGRTVTFQPGYYDDAEALTRLMATCPTSTFWFPGAPGGQTYYFDFHNGEPGRPDGSRVWRIADRRVRLVAGGTTAPGRPSSVTIPGSCTSPQVDTTNNGATFVFGGDSRWEVTAGRVELCGPGDADDGEPPVAILGADHALGDGGPGEAGPETAPRGRRDNTAGMLRMRAGSAADVPGSEPTASFGRNTAERNRIVAWDTRAARANIDGTRVPTGGQQGIVRIEGFDPADASPAATIPPGATLTYANLYVRHREARIGRGRNPVELIHATVTPSRPGAPQVGPIAEDDEFTAGIAVNPDNRRNRYRRDTVDLLATPALQQEVTDHGFSGASVTWLVQSKDDLDLRADLDTIQLAIGWTSPRDLRKQTTRVDGTNCLTRPTSAYPGAGACALVRTASTDGATRFHVQGTGYAPRSPFDLAHENVAAPVFTSGLVGRQVTAGLAPHSDYSGPLISSPEPLTALLRAYNCTRARGCPRPADTATLSAPWEPAGQAKVELNDPGPRIRAGRRAVTVLSWSLRP